MVPEYVQTALARKAPQGEPLAVLVTNAQGSTVWASEAFSDLLGFELKDLAGRKPEDVLYGPETDPATAAAMARAFEARQGGQTSILLYKKHKTAIWVNIETVPLFDVWGEFGGMALYSQAKPEKPTAFSPANDPYQVLVAEDHPINLKLVLALLQAAGCETRFAENGEQALAELNNSEFDLIIMDSQMPVLTGVEAIPVIRNRNDWKKHTPIMSLTAHAMRGAEEFHTSIGADVYMSKPLRSDCFIGAVKDLAKRGRALRLLKSVD